MSPHYVLSLHAIGDISRRSLVSLNFTRLFRIETRISTQLLVMSHGENEVVNAAFNLFTGHFVKFEQCFCSKTDHLTAILSQI